MAICKFYQQGNCKYGSQSLPLARCNSSGVPLITQAGFETRVLMEISFKTVADSNIPAAAATRPPPIASELWREARPATEEETRDWAIKTP